MGEYVAKLAALAGAPRYGMAAAFTKAGEALGDAAHAARQRVLAGWCFQAVSARDVVDNRNPIVTDDQANRDLIADVRRQPY